MGNEPIDVWQWRYFDPARRKHFNTLHMTEDEARRWCAREGCELKERVTWTRQIRMAPDEWQARPGHSSSQYIGPGDPGSRTGD